MWAPIMCSPCRKYTDIEHVQPAHQSPLPEVVAEGHGGIDAEASVVYTDGCDTKPFSDELAAD